MNVLVAHNFYLQPGGEDGSFRANIKLVERLGHRAVAYTVRNESIEKIGRWTLALKTIWNTAIAKEIYDVCIKEHIDIAIFHNTFPLISPAAYSAVKAAGGKVIQWVPNYRLLCSAATLFRDGHICETCISQRVPISGVLHRCYHDSLAASSVVAALIGFHKIRKSWTNDVDRLVANSHIVQQKLVLGGFPEQKISVIYNHLSEDPGMGSGAGGYALFVGRLSPEKGIATMLKAWSRLEMPLKIIGDGPLRSEIEKFCALSSFAEWLGQQSYIDTITAMKEALRTSFSIGMLRHVSACSPRGLCLRDACRGF